MMTNIVHANALDNTTKNSCMSAGFEVKKPEENEFLIVTGMSGAGRSTAVNALEDQGWYVVDNIPPQLITTLTDLVLRKPQSLHKMAIVLDVRSKGIYPDIQDSVNNLRAQGVEFRVLFFDANDDVLIRRFEQGRRPHPLQGEGRIYDGIVAERELLKPLKESAELIIDTSHFNVHQLSTTITELFNEDGVIAIRLTVMSFGFKYGLPADANYVVDVRFIPNPHWIERLRSQTGKDLEVSEYVLKSEGAQEFINHYVKALKPVLNGYRKENKHYATIAIGCTGGKHRSVAVAEQIALRLSTLKDVNVNVIHRDLGRE